MSFITNILNAILGLFRSAAQKAWASLSKDLQNNALTASNLAQLIKTSADSAYLDFVALAVTKTGLTVAQINALLSSIGKDLSIQETLPENIFKSIQEKAKAIDTDNGWAALFQNIAKFAATYLSNGRLDWQSLSFGIIQVAYEKLFKK